MKKSCASKASYQRCYAKKKKVANLCVYILLVFVRRGRRKGDWYIKKLEKKAKRKYDNAMLCYPTWMKKKKKEKKVTEIQLCMKKKEEI